MSSVAESRGKWKKTLGASMANYLDAGSIIAGSTGLVFWSEYLNLTNFQLGLLGAVSANAISAGVGALLGGWLCDKYGRKKIYSYDLIVYMIGILIIIFATSSPLLFIGYIIVGLAVGADIPASWTLIAEEAPAKERGKHSGVAQLLWYTGPVVVLTMSYFLAPYGLLGNRIVFAHLFVVAFFTWLLRRKMNESSAWKEEQNTETKVNKGRILELFQKGNLKSILFLVSMYGIANLVLGTSGFFMPYIYNTVGGQTQETAMILMLTNFILNLLAVYFIFMKFVDKVNHRLLFGIASILLVGGTSLFGFFEITLPIAFVYIFLTSLGAGFAHQNFYQLWSSELFPTRIRATAQGFMFFIIRVGLGFWSLVVPTLAATGFHGLAFILTAFYTVSSLIGFIFAPKTQGKTLKQIETEKREVEIINKKQERIM
ncbi:MFS transporter [Priestia megaterium]|uniref:MFS transporter n=1 Tax=Priestia megaterium TaxID=1404 RepID=UPI002795D7D6|nr:MFS transporter [Priestia megaterium]